MQTIRYQRHFLTLIPAAVLLWLVMRAGGFFLFFGAMGALHATSLVMSLRDRSAVTLGKAVIFVTLVAAVSMLALFSPYLFPLRSVLGESLRPFMGLSVASALGASGYWLLLRWFWLKSRRFVNLITTVALCSAATVACWLSAARMTSSAVDIADLVPTLGWWAAFSFSLYCGDMRWRTRRLESQSS